MAKEKEERLKVIGQILTNKYKATQAFIQYQNISREYEQGDDLFMREAHFIVEVGPGEGKTISEIAAGLAVTHGAASQTASRLEQKGYILRQKSDRDRRHTVVVLTPKGEDLYQRHIQYDMEEYAAMDKAALSVYTDEELALIRDYEALMYAYFTKENSKNW